MIIKNFLQRLVLVKEALKKKIKFEILMNKIPASFLKFECFIDHCSFVKLLLLILDCKIFKSIPLNQTRIKMNKICVVVVILSSFGKFFY